MRALRTITAPDGTRHRAVHYGGDFYKIQSCPPGGRWQGVGFHALRRDAALERLADLEAGTDA